MEDKEECWRAMPGGGNEEELKKCWFPRHGGKPSCCISMLLIFVSSRDQLLSRYPFLGNGTSLQSSKSSPSHDPISRKDTVRCCCSMVSRWQN